MTDIGPPCNTHTYLLKEMSPLPVGPVLNIAVTPQHKPRQRETSCTFMIVWPPRTGAALQVRHGSHSDLLIQRSG